jgi:hypothetical protein
MDAITVSLDLEGFRVVQTRERDDRVEAVIETVVAAAENRVLDLQHMSALGTRQQAPEQQMDQDLITGRGRYRTRSSGGESEFLHPSGRRSVG